VSEALQALPLNADWIVLDLMLPDGSGVRVIEQLRRSGLSSSVCVVSGCHQTLIDEALRAGAAFALSKPLNVSRLLDVLVGSS
jgi:response regulator of citrate/malate metabolism